MKLALHFARDGGQEPIPDRVSGLHYRCHSWRHDGDWRRWIASQNYARVKAALLPLRPRDVVYVVLTLDPKRQRWEGWDSRYVAFQLLMKKWRSLRKAITRTFGRNRYVATVEVHRSGWPHLNVVMEAPPARRGGPPPQQGANVRVAEAGGRPVWLRLALLAGASAKQGSARNDVVKVAGDVEQPAKADATGSRLTGEVVKLTQLPEDAPPLKSVDVTGKIVPRPPPPGALDCQRRRKKR